MLISCAAVTLCVFGGSLAEVEVDRALAIIGVPWMLINATVLRGVVWVDETAAAVGCKL